MCYSEEQSRKSFIINLITCYILYKTKSPTFKILALFFVFVGIMQFLDIIFWNNQDIKDPNQAQINWVTTKIAMFANHLQPIILAYLIYVYKGSLGNFSNIILPIYVVAISIYSFNAYNKINYTLKEEVSVRNLFFQKAKPSLKWDWNIQQHNLLVYIIFLLTLLILAYENFEYPLNIVLAFINLFTFVLSAYYFKGRSIGRFWCKFAAWLPLFFILIPH